MLPTATVSQQSASMTGFESPSLLRASAMIRQALDAVQKAAEVRAKKLDTENLREIAKGLKDQVKALDSTGPLLKDLARELKAFRAALKPGLSSVKGASASSGQSMVGMAAEAAASAASTVGSGSPKPVSSVPVSSVPATPAASPSGKLGFLRKLGNFGAGLVRKAGPIAMAGAALYDGYNGTETADALREGKASAGDKVTTGVAGAVNGFLMGAPNWLLGEAGLEKGMLALKDRLTLSSRKIEDSERIYDSNTYDAMTGLMSNVEAAADKSVAMSTDRAAESLRNIEEVEEDTLKKTNSLTEKLQNFLSSLGFHVGSSSSTGTGGGGGSSAGGGGGYSGSKNTASASAANAGSITGSSMRAPSVFGPMSPAQEKKLAENDPAGYINRRAAMAGSPQITTTSDGQGNIQTTVTNAKPMASTAEMPAGANMVKMENTGIRNKDINDNVRDQLNYAAAQNGVKVSVTSGGQDASGPRRTGSHRHDDGGAADIKLYREDANGKRTYLDMSKPEDAAVMQNFVKDSVKAGATGVGAGYMGAHTMHIGGGSKASWGGASWIEQARQQGEKEKKDFDLQKWKEGEAAKAAATKPDGTKGPITTTERLTFSPQTREEAAKEQGYKSGLGPFGGITREGMARRDELLRPSREAAMELDRETSRAEARTSQIAQTPEPKEPPRIYDSQEFDAVGNSTGAAPAAAPPAPAPDLDIQSIPNKTSDTGLENMNRRDE